MITIQKGDLTKLEGVFYICNAANGIGPMGAGVAGAIRRAAGHSVQQEAFSVCRKQDPRPGDLYVTSAGKLPFKAVLHLVTMKQPGERTHYDIVEACLHSLISYCRGKKIDKVALPALGTGVGRLDKKRVADIYKKILSPIEDIEFLVVDIDEIFLNSF